jgi:hypothetical protein
MGQIKISPQFSGGAAVIQVVFPDAGASFDITSETSQPVMVNLPQGSHFMQVSGQVPDHGSVDIQISGDIPSNFIMKFGGGTIPVYNSVVFVNK